jgi:hypothetical protein
MAEDLKAATPDTTFAWATAGLFGADSQAAASPSYFPASDVRAALLALANTWAANGAASTPPMLLSGTWFTDGSATTTKPQFLVEPADTTSTGWSTAGTGFGVNASSGFTGNLIDFQLNGDRKFAVNAAGNIISDNAALSWTAANTLAFDFTCYFAGASGAASRMAMDASSGLIVRSDFAYGFSSTTAANVASDTTLVRVAAGIVGVRAANAAAGSALSFLEQTAPAGAANEARIYADDSGGKTRLMVIMPTGSAIQLAIEV